LADNLSVILTETITPWLLGTLILLAALTLTITIKSWREMKRSPYFFMRRQAEKRLQTYASASFFLVLFAVAVAFYSWQPPTNNVPRVAILTNAKPPKEDIVQIFADAQPAAVLAPADIEEMVAANAAQPVEASLRSSEPTLPDKFNQVEPLVSLQDNTDLGTIAFSTEISDQYEAINSRKLFAEGFYTLYATFSYDDMADGMAWSWLWRHNGEVVEGDNELWEYGSNGPGYIYFNPDDGFQYGEYSLEVWVNGELLAQSAVTMNSAAVAAGN
jgi:hypothetical protein